MDTKWLEDFVSLAETRSFSRSAQLRHVTQPAFSRRIQSLESWAGVDLIDRSSYPTSLTPAGEMLYEHTLDILQALQSARALLRAHSVAGQDFIEFAVSQTLAHTFFPGWVSSLSESFGSFKSRLIALDVQDAVGCLVAGNCDLLVTFFHASQPLPLNAERFETIRLGEELIVPVCRASTAAAPQHVLPGRTDAPAPYLGYTPAAYLGQVVDACLRQSAEPIYLQRVYETEQVENLRAMALEGHGIAFLPFSAIRQDLRAKRLVSAVPESLQGMKISLEIRLCRERPAGAPGQQGGARQIKNAARGLWDFLASAKSPPTIGA